MHETINERVSVVTIYSRETGKVAPVSLRWHGRDYRIRKVGYHHQTRPCRAWVHVFSVSTEAMAFKLRHHPEDLSWVLEEVSDGIAH
jgi:hypothetical protein